MCVCALKGNDKSEEGYIFYKCGCGMMKLINFCYKVRRTYSLRTFECSILLSMNNA